MSESLIKELKLDTQEETEFAGRRLAAALLDAQPESLCIFLQGELGAGKTTLARGFLRGMGYAGRVPSPTYTLVEPYESADYRIAHLDLYRLHAGAELEYLGIDELTGPGSLLLVEWPERGGDSLPASDIQITLEVISNGRMLRIDALSDAGIALFDVLSFD
jgi:tRNA threonylcarbamoyladenosine biosynthesis protein TsaE